MKTIIISTSLGLIIGAGAMFLTSYKGSKTDYSQKMIQALDSSTVIAEYTGGKITAEDTQELVQPLFEKTRSELLQAYVRAAEEVLVKRNADRLSQEAEEVSEVELSLYMKSNRIDSSRKDEIQNFLKVEKMRIQSQLGRMKLLQDLNFQNKLGAAHFDLSESSDFPTRGNSSAKIKVHVFCDFGNPLCQRSRLTMEGLLNQFKENTQWVYRHFPVASNQIGDEASLISICAHEQKKFWAVHDLFYNNQNVLTSEKMMKLAEQAGLNPEELAKCLQTEGPKQQLTKEKRTAENLGLNTTPVFFVNGMKISDPEKVLPTVQTLL